MTLSTLDFYRILYTICKNYPKVFLTNGGQQIEQKCKRTNTFAVVHSQNQVNAANLEKDVRYKDKDLFYSRFWEEQESHPSLVQFYYPALLVAEANTTIRNTFTQKESRTTFNLFVLDKMPSKALENASMSDCALRSFEEVGADLREIMDNIIGELSDWGYYRLEDILTMQIIEGWYPDSWVASQTDYDYEHLADLSAYLVGDVQASVIYRAFADDLAGFFLNLTVINTTCPKREFQYNFSPKNFIPDSSI
jgi:hypothetical protein